MREFLLEVRSKVPLAVVGGSDLAKIVEQLGDSLEDGMLVLVRYVKSFTFISSDIVSPFINIFGRVMLSICSSSVSRSFRFLFKVFGSTEIKIQLLIL